MRNSIRRSCGTLSVAIAHPALNFRSAGNRVDDTWKFHQHTVARQFHDASLMLRNFAVDEIRLEVPSVRRVCRSHPRP